MSRIYLGLDSSTQGLTGTLIDVASGRVLDTLTVNFEADLPSYRTRNGVLRDIDPTVVHGPPLMWAAALDLLFARMKEQRLPIRRVQAMAGSGQQHGSVYLNATAAARLARLDARRSLADQLADVFSRPTAPIWMDSSTRRECDEITRSLESSGGVVELTGSAAFERFTGPQIRKFYREQPEAYQRTAHIGLVSSFMASLLTGRLAPIDQGDGAGMNLMDIRNRTWSEAALTATAPELGNKLPPLCPPWEILGPISPYFVECYGFDPATRCVAWSGDNPNSVIGLGLIEPGQVAISLGTSDTFFGTMRRCQVDPRGEGHVFVSPTGDYMTLICFKNGSLAREQVRDQYRLDWAGFDAALESTLPGNRGQIMLPYFEPEIVPRVFKAGVRRIGLDAADAAANCRAVVEAQMTSMRIHSAWMKVSPSSIKATGGASRNRAILQVMADVFQCPILTGDVSNSASLGAALRAAHADLKQPWAEIVDPFTKAVTAARPNPALAAVYRELAERYTAAETQACACY